MIIAIAGASASGKTTLAQGFCQALVISQDQYYWGEFETQVGNKRNGDHPDSCDLSQLAQDLLVLKQGRTVSIPKYDFKLQKRVGNRLVKPEPFIIVEGLWTLYDRSIRELADLKIYVEAPFNIRLLRMVERDHERGRRVWDTLDYIKNVETMMQVYVSPYKKYADLIIQT